jgi:hypothetical protein
MIKKLDIELHEEFHEAILRGDNKFFWGRSHFDSLLETPLQIAMESLFPTAAPSP